MYTNAHKQKETKVYIIMNFNRFIKILPQHFILTPVNALVTPLTNIPLKCKIVHQFTLKGKIQYQQQLGNHCSPSFVLFHAYMCTMQNEFSLSLSPTLLPDFKGLACCFCVSSYRNSKGGHCPMLFPRGDTRTTQLHKEYHWPINSYIKNITGPFTHT